MKLYSKDISIINGIYSDLKENDTIVKRVIAEDTRAGNMGSYLELAKISVIAINAIIAYLTYHHLTEEKHYIHLKYKDGTEIKFTNLTKEKKKEKLAKLKDTWGNLTYIDLG
ncbi:MAG TPA: hypothetical protein EYG73_01995 [Arcobacter sp.]|nr:hypothetical protein [Arcobacter sp.]